MPTLRFHEIAETNHLILNPFTQDKLMLLGETCRLNANSRQLDLACGKGEMLCRWARTFGISGVGVDINDVFLNAAHERAEELSVADRVTFIKHNATDYNFADAQYDVVSCIGATWIGDGLLGTIELLRPAVKDGGLLLIGEPYWITPPPQAAYAVLGVAPDDYVSLIDTLDRFESANIELLEMVLANQDSWDRYEASQWLTIANFLRDHPDDTDATELREWMNANRRAYLKYGREYFGWGVFVLRFR